MSQQWYYQKDGKTRGPISRDQLRQLVVSGELTGGAQVIRDGMSQWVPASSIDVPKKAASPPPVNASVRKPPLPQSPPRPAPPTFRRPPVPRRKPNRLPLYFGSLVAVAILAALLGWMANSLSSSKNDHKSEKTAQLDSTSSRSDTLKQQSFSQPRAQSSNEITVNRRAERNGQNTIEASSEKQTQSSRGVAEQRTSSAAAALKTKSTETTHTEQSNDQTPFESSKITGSSQQDSVTAQVTAEKLTSEQSAAKPNASGKQTPVVLFQELDIRRQPKLSMLGSVMAQDIQYRILSELSVGHPDEKGFREVQQVVKDTQLVKADPLSQAMFADSLKRLIGWQFSYTLNFRNEVIEIRGPDDGKKIAPVKPAGAQGFLMTSVMDEDGWKELAELSFFTPDPKGLQNQSWTRQMTHNFEPLGSWFGQTTFVPRGRQRSLMRIDYAHKLTYKPPAKGAAGAGGLPFTVKNADLKAATAGGVIYYDTDRKRVQSAEEQFHVGGTITADALGQVLNLPIEEKQAITVRILDQYPWDNRND